MSLAKPFRVSDPECATIPALPPAIKPAIAAGVIAVSQAVMSDAGSDFDLLERLRPILAARLGGDGYAELIDTVSGNINLIYKLRYQGRMLGARVMTNTYRFRYEPGIIKEIFAILLLYHARGASGDDLARAIVDGALSSPTGGHVGHALVRTVVHYDWSLSVLPWPFFIHEWVDGEILWHAADPENYRLAGRDLATLHRVRFQHFYRDIFQIRHQPLSWREGFAQSLARELEGAAERLPGPVVDQLRALNPADWPEAPACLVHNDYSGGNILIEAQGRHKIIDWDNWMVEAPELDLVKMRYWTKIGADNVLAPDSTRFAAFLDGYRAAAEQPPDPGRARAYESLWLLRAFNFESARRPESEVEVAGVRLAAHYPSPAAYVDWLREV
ncbi:Phosphotransferase [uncultured Gammaproteobacteria bacterium]